MWPTAYPSKESRPTWFHRQLPPSMQGAGHLYCFRCSRTGANIFQVKHSLHSMSWCRGRLPQHALKRSPASLEEENKTQRPGRSCCVDGSRRTLPSQDGTFPEPCTHMPLCLAQGPARAVCWMNKQIKHVLKTDIINLNLTDEGSRRTRWAGKDDPGTQSRRTWGVCSQGWLGTSNQSVESSWELQKTHFFHFWNNMILQNRKEQLSPW